MTQAKTARGVAREPQRISDEAVRNATGRGWDE